MNLKTFTAPTFQVCLQLVKQEYGPNAVILHTRTYYKRKYLGLSKKEFVEITAGKPLANQTRRSAPAMVTALSKPSGTMTQYAPTQTGGSVATMPAPPGKALLNMPVANTIMTRQVARDVEDLKKLVLRLVDVQDKKDAPNVPEELFEHYMSLIGNQVASELASEIITTIRKQLRPEHLGNVDFVKEKIAEHIAKLIPTGGPIVRTKTTGPHVVALIGPTGVGKTTTIAKLAANLKLVEKKNVGLITIDTYRIAAVDQLRRYAEILGSRVIATNNADDLREAVRSMRDCEYILIDTAGRSPNDAMKIHELKTFLDAACPDEIHLVLCSTAHESCVDLAVEKFSEVHFDRVIFTKLDEAAHVGVVLNTIRKINKSVSYITTGQDVPDDIEVGEAKRLGQLIVRGTL